MKHYLACLSWTIKIYFHILNPSFYGRQQWDIDGQKVFQMF